MARVNSPARVRVGVDTGGTFTDFVCFNADGLHVHKLRSTPTNPTQAVLQGIVDLAGFAQPLEIIHGSTVATNAVLEGKGARVALLTTTGFEDVLRIGRQTRPELYNLFVGPRPLLANPRLVFGIPERLTASGKVLIQVDRSALQRVIKKLKHLSVEMVAVCLLHSYVNPSHEREVATWLRRAGFLVCASHEVLPEYREFERWSTTLLNAYVTPLVGRYLAQLERSVGSSSLHIMQSNGGAISATAARAQAVRTVLSGPAGGVVGARAVARAAGFNRIISFDMGGTSTDVSLIDGEIATTTDSVIGGFPLRLPMLDIHTVGAGGGSIVTIDSGGALRVGPRSAGAQPGPACYGSGQELTVTDANLLLGRLDPECFLGGRMLLQLEPALDLARELARRLKLSVAELAEGIIRVANANLERALRVVSVQRGHDPREFALVAFGGAGGMHACELAERLELGTIIVPRHAGVLSALGMLLADVTKDYSASVLRPTATLDIAELRRRFQPLLAAARHALLSEGFTTQRQVLETLLDLRYIGQSYELTLPFSKDFRRQFDQRHARIYGYSDPGRPTEVVNLRVRALGLTDKPALPCSPFRIHKPRPSSIRPACFNGKMIKTGFYHWAALAPGARAQGPAVVTGADATVVILPRFSFSVDPFANVVIRR
jgi:N-methylhydantoinase A/oxoprolinase/acetone carboxylase beta subunit